MNVLKQKFMPLQPSSPQRDAPAQRPSARSPPPQKYSVLRVITAEETTVEKDTAEPRNESFLNEPEERTASFTNEEFARFERTMEKRDRAAAPAIAAPIDGAPAQPINPRSRCSGIPLDVRVYMNERIEGKMEPEQGELESLLAGMGLEHPDSSVS